MRPIRATATNVAAIWGVILAPFINSIIYMPDQNAIIPYDTILPAVGGVAGGLAGKIAGAARSVVCPLYRDFPSYMTGEWANNPISKYNDSFLNQFCAPANQLPSPPTTPFNGGQCTDRDYVVNVVVNQGGTIVNTGNNVLAGAIGSIFIKSADSGAGGSTVVGVAVNYRVRPGQATLQAVIYGNVSPPLSIVSISVTPVGGGNDPCGNPPLQYPVTTPPAAALQVNVPVQVSPNFNVTVPVSVFAPINIFSPTLKVGDFNVDFSLGGLTVSPTLNVNFPGNNPSGNPQPSPPTGTTPTDRNYDELLSAIFRYVKRLRECQNCDSDYDFLVTGVVAGSSGSITVPIGGIPLTAAVTLVTLPSNLKTQPGRGQPDVIFAGWGWWSGNDYLTERRPIDAQTKLFYAPENPSPAKFHFTVTPGYAAQMLMSYKKRKNPLPPL